MGLKKRSLIVLALLLTSIGSMADVADFIYSKNCEGSNVVFVSKSNASSGSIVSFKWDLNNDGIFTDATGSKVNWNFPNPGNYQVGLRITNSNSTVTTAYKNIKVNPLAKPNFLITEGCDAKNTKFTDFSTLSSGSIVKYKWDYNVDGVYDDSSGNMVNHKYSTSGLKSTKLEVVTDSGCISTVTKPFVVHPNPKVNFSFDNTCWHDITQFKATGTVSSGYISEYHWNFDGDGIFEDTTFNSNNSLMFITSGNYLVKVQAETDKGCVKDTIILVTIAPRPTLNFTFSNFCENTSISFDNSFSNAATFLWNFGDGGSSSVKSPIHTYTNAGIYQIKLKGSSTYGCYDSISKGITIYPTPTSNFKGDNVCLGTLTKFTNQSMPNGSPIKDYNWDFGDYHGEISESPKHLYGKADSFRVSLIVANHFGCRDTSFKWVQVWQLPVTKIIASGLAEFCKGDSIHLSVNPGTSNVIWSTGEVSSQITAKTSKNYKAIIYDSKGCMSKDSLLVTVYDLPDLKVSPSDTEISLGQSVELLAWGAITYEWTPNQFLSNSNIENPVASPLETTTYTVTGDNQYGCKKSVDVKVKVNRDYVLNVDNLFTPNGDGANDLWDINISLYEDNEVIIYNRWGVEVFRQENYLDSWNGSFKGDPLPDGAYYYIIKFTGSDKVYTGSVTILR